MAPSEENGHGVDSPDMVHLAKRTVMRTAGVVRHGFSGEGPGAAPSGGVFGAGGAVFDASRALAVLGNLAETSEAETAAAALMEQLEGRLTELRGLRTSAAEQSLSEHREAVAARDAAMEGGVRAMREELADTRRRLAEAEAALRELRERPPPPSEAAVRAHPVFEEEAEARERAERRLAVAERRLAKADKAKAVLLKAAGKGGSRGSGAAAAMAREVQDAEERASDMAMLVSALTGMEARREDDDGRVWTLALAVEDETVELSVELIHEEDEEDGAGSDAGEAVMEVRPVAGRHLLPEAMRAPFSMAMEEGPAFLTRLLTHFMGDGEDADEGADA